MVARGSQDTSTVTRAVAPPNPPSPPDGRRILEAWRQAVSAAPEEPLSHLGEQAQQFLPSLVDALKETHPSTPEEFLSCLSELARTLLENVALAEQLHHRETQVRRLLAEALEAQDVERERLSLELHDGLAQTLRAAHGLMGAYSRLAPLEGLVDQLSLLLERASRECRDLLQYWLPPPLAPEGLEATLRQELLALAQTAEWSVDFRSEPLGLPRDVETHLHRMVREALMNAKRHAGTQHVQVSLGRSQGRVVAEVRDQGKGFDPSTLTAEPGRSGSGLTSMQRRAQLLGGSCTITSGPGQGTTVRVELPVG